jgi:hypothetical protein
MARSIITLRARDPLWEKGGPTAPIKVARVLAVAVLAGCAGLAGASSLDAIVAITAVVLLCLYIWYATVRRRNAIIILFASLTLVPVYVAPTYRTFSPEPTAVAALAVALALFKAGDIIRWTVVDVAFTATCGTMVLAAWLGPHSLLATGSELFLWIPAYLAGRAICKRYNGAETFVLAAVIGGLLALPFIAYETISRHNVFFGLAKAGSALTTLWAHPAFRPGGLLRSEGAFGHPLTMAVIIGSCAVFALALGVRAKGRLRQAAWLCGAVALAIGQYTSHERSGWTVVIGGVLIFAAAAIPRGARLKNAFIVGVVAIPLCLVAISASEPANGAAAVARTGSTADRLALWRHALEPGALALVGWPETVNFNHFANAVHPGQVAIDSGYLQIGDVFGVIALIALFTVVAAVVRVAVAVRGTWAAIIPAVALADLIALTVIGFQTQLPVFIWLVVGGASGVELRRRRSRQEAPTELAEPLPEYSVLPRLSQPARPASLAARVAKS